MNREIRFPSRFTMVTKTFRLCWAAFFSLGTAWMLSGCNIKVENSVGAEPTAQAGEYLFCHWNVENFFDDKHDKRHQKADVEFDEWFANDKAALNLKLTKLTEALLKMNDGHGPDILAICEVESPRAAELLMEALNKKLDSRWQYLHVLMKDLNGGRHIAPAIITRLPVRKELTRLHGKMLRILEGHVVVDGKELTIFATHWTSRVNAGTESGRDKYADTIYKAFAEMYHNNPSIDVLVSGDFNDTPHDESVVKHLHSTADVSAVRSSRSEPLLYNLLASKDSAKGFGTHFYNGHWYTFDQILVSPAMLQGNGWICETDSIQVFNSLYRPGDTQKRPWRFGNENEHGVRGYSDHFPVMVKLRVK
jgi:endonuclease/exonuclease/phosphatase family metal-dependent hydrolase